MSSKSGPVTTLVIYKPKKGKFKELQALVEKHGPTLAKTGLLSDEPVRVWVATDKRGHGEQEPYFVELMAWRDDEASNIAHQTPEIMAIWEPMGPLLEELKLTKLEPFE
jgi:quinol monooxygenase YgiN